MKTQTIGLTTLLVIFWLANSGHYTALILGLGLASIILVVVVAKRMNVVDAESVPFHLSRELPTYYLWLLKELVISNLQVVRRIWMSNKSLEPTVETIDINQADDMGRVIFANSISLTPGTITTAVTESSITVHALDRSSIEALKSGEMANRIRRLSR